MQKHLHFLKNKCILIEIIYFSPKPTAVFQKIKKNRQMWDQI